jgi:hypothetical protein
LHVTVRSASMWTLLTCLLELVCRYKEAVSALLDPPLRTVAGLGALTNCSGHTLLSLAAISGCVQNLLNCFDAGNKAFQRDHHGQHALQLALMCVYPRV